MMAKVHYNNNIFNFRGKIGRVSYLIQYTVVSALGFKYLYYPFFVELYRAMLANPETKDIIAVLYQSPVYAPMFDNFANALAPTTLDTVIKYLFFIPLRILDIKRIRDVINSELSLAKTVLAAVLLSIQGIDLIGTILLAVIPPNRFAKNSDIVDEALDQDMTEAKVEYDLMTYKKLFEEGKISKAEYLKVLEKNRKIH